MSHHAIHLHHLLNVHLISHFHHFKIPNYCGCLKKLGKLCNWPKWVMLIVTIVVGISSLVLTVVNYIGKNGITTPFTDVSGSATMIPHASRVIPVQGLFCETFTISRFYWDDSQADMSWNATVSITFEEPPSEFNDFCITNQLQLDESNYFYMREFYLHSGSKITINSCVLQNAPPQVIQVCIINGITGFNYWLNNNHNCTGARMHKYGLSSCSNESEILQALKYIVNETGTYYIVHYTSTKSGNPSRVFMDVSVLSLNSYALNSNFTCTTNSYNSCTTANSIPLTSRGYAVVSVNANDSESGKWSYEDKIKVSWNCNPSKNGFILITVLPAVGIFITIFMFGCLLNCCKKRQASTRRSITSLSSEACSSRERLIPIHTQSVDVERRLLINPSQNTSDKLKNFNNNFKILVCTRIPIIVLLALSFTFMEGILPIIAQNPSGLVFMPGGTHLFEVNKFLCSSLSVDISGSTHLSASVWLTDQTPNRTNFSTFIPYNFQCNDTNGCFEPLRFFLDAESEVRAINYGNTSVYFRTFFNEDNYKTFLGEKNFDKDAKFVDVYNNNTQVSLHHKDKTNILVLYVLPNALVNISLEIVRTEYNITTNHSSSPPCDLHSYTISSCKLPVPLGAGSTHGLLQVTSDNDDVEYLTVETQCNYRASTWTVIWLPILIINLIFFFTLCTFLYALQYNHYVKKITQDEDSAGQSNSDGHLQAHDTANNEIDHSFQGSSVGSAKVMDNPQEVSNNHSVIVPITNPDSNTRDKTSPVPITGAALVTAAPSLVSDNRDVDSGLNNHPPKDLSATAPLLPPANEDTNLPGIARLVDADVQLKKWIDLLEMFIVVITCDFLCV